MARTLYVVGTPIGNLGDMSPRALDTLRAVDFIAAEDTRVTLKLLTHFGIRKPLVCYREHNARESGERIAERVASGEDCALVTDAGMPGVSDPGGDLVRLCAERGIAVAVVPGPTAFAAAVAVSGFTGRFTFEGFLSTSNRSRMEHLDSLKSETRTMVFYEAPHKLTRTLRDMLAALGDRRVSVSRELTKLHEETLRVTLSEAVELYEHTPPRGEFVLVVEGAATVATRTDADNADDAVVLARSYVDGGMTLRDAVRRAATETGYPKNALYDALLDGGDE